MSRQPFSPWVLVGGVMGILLIVAALIFGLAIIDHVDGETTPFLVTILAIAGAAIPSIIALAKTDSTDRKIDKVSDDMTNGVMRDNLKRALTEADNEYQAKYKEDYHNGR